MSYLPISNHLTTVSNYKDNRIIYTAARNATLYGLHIYFDVFQADVLL